MAKIYADLIRKGRKTMDDVPEKLQNEVRSILKNREVWKEVGFAYLFLLYLLLLSIYQHEYILTVLGVSLQPFLDSMVKWGISYKASL